VRAEAAELCGEVTRVETREGSARLAVRVRWLATGLEGGGARGYALPNRWEAALAIRVRFPPRAASLAPY
jgi:hypothetical protein